MTALTWAERDAYRLHGLPLRGETLLGSNVVAARRRGVRTINGTDWPVTDRLERQQHGRRVSWVVVIGLCNGVPDVSYAWRTYREAGRAWVSGDYSGAVSVERGRP